MLALPPLLPRVISKDVHNCKKRQATLGCARTLITAMSTNKPLGREWKDQQISNVVLYSEAGWGLEVACIGPQPGGTAHRDMCWKSVRTLQGWERMPWALSGQRLAYQATCQATWNAQESAAYNFLNLDSDSILQKNTPDIFCQGFNIP